MLGPVPLERLRRDTVGCERAGHFLNRALVFGEFELACAGIDRSVHPGLPKPNVDLKAAV